MIRNMEANEEREGDDIDLETASVDEIRNWSKKFYNSSSQEVDAAIKELIASTAAYNHVEQNNGGKHELETFLGLVRENAAKVKSAVEGSSE